MFGKSMVKKAVVCLMLAGWAATADAQYIPAYQPDSFAVKAVCKVGDGGMLEFRKQSS